MKESERGRLVRVGALLVLCSAIGVAPKASAQTLSAPEVKRLRFEGNQAFPSDSLRLGIINRQTECRPLLGLFCRLGSGFAFDREFLVRRQLPGDVLRLLIYYHERGYREAVVDTSLVYSADPARVNLTFRVREGRPILVDSIRFVGDVTIAEGTLLRDLPLREGDPLSAVRMDLARDSLLVRLRNEGYVHADVLLSRFIPTAKPYAATLVFDIDAGPRARVGDLDILVTGDADLADEVVRRMLPFEVGSIYRTSEIQQGQRNLYGLEIVRNALIAPDTARLRTSPDTLVPLAVVVGTSTLRRMRVGGGWNTSDCLSTDARWTNRNVLGGAERLQVAGRLSNIAAEGLQGSACPLAGTDEFGGINWSVSAELNLPWVFSPRNALATSLFWERQSLPDVFIRQSVGLNIALTRSLGLRMPAALSYRPQRTKLEAAGLFFCTSMLVCNPDDISVLEDPNWLAPVTFGVSRDRTDNLLNPANGYIAHAELEVAGGWSGSDFSYSRTTGDITTYWSPGSGSVFAARLRGGWVGAAEFGDRDSGTLDVIHPQKRFFAGGSGSVRGFAQNRLGPRVLSISAAQLLGPAQVVGGDTVLVGSCAPAAIMDFTCDGGSLDDDEFTQRPTGGTRLIEGNLEYRASMGSAFQGVTFMDFGQVWGEREVFDLGGMEWTPGVGIRYFSPIGPLRIDVAYRSRRGEALPVVTSRVRAFVPGEDAEGDRIGVDLVDAERQRTGATVLIPWVRREELALLGPSVLFGAGNSFLRRLQIHISIGQAF